MSNLHVRKQISHDFMYVPRFFVEKANQMGKHPVQMWI